MVNSRPCRYSRQTCNMLTNARRSRSCTGKLLFAALSVFEAYAICHIPSPVTCSSTAPTAYVEASVMNSTSSSGLIGVRKGAKTNIYFNVFKLKFSVSSVKSFAIAE